MLYRFYYLILRKAQKETPGSPSGYKSKGYKIVATVSR